MTRYLINVFDKNGRYANPCAVYIRQETLPNDTMQRIALEEKRSETAFIAKHSDGYVMRVFSPVMEMRSCLHATLAAFYALQRDTKTPPTAPLRFHGEPVQGKCEGNVVTLVVPASRLFHQDYLFKPRYLCGDWRAWVARTASNRWRLMLEADSVESVLAVESQAVAREDDRHAQVESYFCYASLREARSAFYGRMFAPKLGIAEDPVNGNACVALYQELSSNHPVGRVTFIQNHNARFSIEQAQGNLLIKAGVFRG